MMMEKTVVVFSHQNPKVNWPICRILDKVCQIMVVSLNIVRAFRKKQASHCVELMLGQLTKEI